jgi:hypothetical protein
LCKVPTKEAWGEYCILSPEKSSRSTSGSPLSKSAKQAWVVEQTFVEQQMVGPLTVTQVIDYLVIYV